MKMMNDFLTAVFEKLGFTKAHGFATEAEWNEHEEEQETYNEEEYPLFV